LQGFPYGQPVLKNYFYNQRKQIHTKKGGRKIKIFYLNIAFYTTVLIKENKYKRFCYWVKLQYTNGNNIADSFIICY
jgi:hypothetical protein